MANPTTPSVTGLIRHTRRSEKIWLPVWQDKNNVGISNSAKQLPIKPYYECFAVGVYDIHSVRELSDANFKSQLDSLNNGSWRGWPRYHAWISEIHCDGPRTIGDAVNVENVHHVVRCINRPGGWRFHHPDVGYIFLDGTYKNFQDEPGEPPIGKLDGSGGKLGMAAELLIQFDDVKQEIDFTTALGM
jgi:hypothetical protein